MSYLGSWKIDDFLTFYCNTHTSATGAATDADSVPTYRIYEDETTTPIATGSMALIDSTNTAGFYSERVQLTAAIGYEKGKCYSIYITATVASVAGTMHHQLQIEAEVDANTVSGTVANVTTCATVTNLTETIEAAVWDVDATAHQTQGTFGQAIGDTGTTLPSLVYRWNAVSGIADSGTTTTMVDAGRTEADTDYWKGATLTFIGGNLLGQSRLVTAFNPATDTLTFAPPTTQAVTTQTYVLASNPGISDVNAVSSTASAAIAAAVTGTAGADPSSVPAANASLLEKINWICAWFRNRQTMNRSTGVVNLRNDADSGTIGTYTASDDGTQFTRPEVT